MPTWQTSAQIRFGLPSYGPYYVQSGDLSGDGLLDVVTADLAEPTVSILLGNGDGTLQPPMQISVGSTPARVLIEDFDLDGRNDLLVSYNQERVIERSHQTWHTDEDPHYRGARQRPLSCPQVVCQVVRDGCGGDGGLHQPV